MRSICVPRARARFADPTWTQHRKPLVLTFRRMTTSVVLALAAVLGVSGVEITPIGGGNALTLPAHRHLLRIDPGGGPPIWMLAIQKYGEEGHGLVFLRSDDEAQTWRYYADIEPDLSRKDRADLVQVGNDIALVYSHEASKVTGSADNDVWFQWWRYDPSTRDFRPQPAVRALDSSSSRTAHHRGELAIDSLGRIWVHSAFLESDGDFSLTMAVSVDGGRTFVRQPDLDKVDDRAGGRLLSLGNKLLIVYDEHDSGTPARYRLRADSDPLDVWSPVREAFPEGIYHGAALSAVASPEGGMHLVYKDEDDDLLHRYFDGERWGPRLSISTGNDWAVQPAITLRGDELVIFYSRSYQTDHDYDFRVRVLRGGVLTEPRVLDDDHEFKGYPAAPPTLPASVPFVPCFFAALPEDNTEGFAKMVRLPMEAVEPLPSDGGTGGGTDAGVPQPDAGTVVDAGTPPPPTDAGTPPPVDAGLPSPPDAGTGSGLLFSDDFERTGGLGSAWLVDRGTWSTDGRARSTRTGTNAIRVAPVQCADCLWEATLETGGRDASIFLRAPASRPSDGYELLLRGSGEIQLRSWVSGSMRILARLSGAANTSRAVRLGLEVTGNGPVALTAFVDGVMKLTATDTSSGLPNAGFAGMWTGDTNVTFDAVRLWSSAGTLPPPPPPPPPPEEEEEEDPPPPTTGRLFFDDFTRSGSALGADWVVADGTWQVSNGEVATVNRESSAIHTVRLCRDCRAEVVAKPGSARAMLFVRAPPSRPSDGYDLTLDSDGDVELSRWVDGVKTVLGTAEVARPDSSRPARLTLEAAGVNPTRLRAWVDGVEVLTANDSTAKLQSEGHAGVWTNRAAVRFDDFALNAVAP